MRLVVRTRLPALWLRAALRRAAAQAMADRERRAGRADRTGAADAGAGGEEVGLLPSTSMLRGALAGRRAGHSRHPVPVAKD